MDNAKQELETKLRLAQAKLRAVEEELSRLDGLIMPLAAQKLDAQREEKYLRMRVEKLQGILAKQ